MGQKSACQGRRHRENQACSLGQEDTLEEETATHSRIWKIPWMRRAKWATVHGVTKSWTHLSSHACKVGLRSNVGRMLAKQMETNAITQPGWGQETVSSVNQKLRIIKVRNKGSWKTDRYVQQEPQKDTEGRD